MQQRRLRRAGPYSAEQSGAHLSQPGQQFSAFMPGFQSQWAQSRPAWAARSPGHAHRSRARRPGRACSRCETRRQAVGRQAGGALPWWAVPQASLQSDSHLSQKQGWRHAGGRIAAAQAVWPSPARGAPCCPAARLQAHGLAAEAQRFTRGRAAEDEGGAARGARLMLGAWRKPCCSPSNSTRAVGMRRPLSAANISSAWLGGTTLSSRPCSSRRGGREGWVTTRAGKDKKSCSPSCRAAGRPDQRQATLQMEHGFDLLGRPARTWWVPVSGTLERCAVRQRRAAGWAKPCCFVARRSTA